MFKFKLTPDGADSFEVQGSSRDILQWERRNKGASFRLLREEQRITDLYKIAFIAAVRVGKFSGTEVEFMESVELDMLDPDEDDEADPTQAAASTAS